jgi:hypothetical protein
MHATLRIALAAALSALFALSAPNEAYAQKTYLDCSGDPSYSLILEIDYGAAVVTKYSDGRVDRRPQPAQITSDKITWRWTQEGEPFLKERYEVNRYTGVFTIWFDYPSGMSAFPNPATYSCRKGQAPTRKF